MPQSISRTRITLAMSSTMTKLCYSLIIPTTELSSRTNTIEMYLPDDVCLRALLCYVEGTCQPLIITIKRTMPNVSNAHRNNCWHASFRDAPYDILHDIFYATLYERKTMLWNNTVKENTYTWLHSGTPRYATQSRSYIQPNQHCIFHTKYCRTYSRTFFGSLV